NGDCRCVLLEAPVDALLLVDAYIQGIISSPDIENQIKEIMQMFFTNNSEVMGFVDWLMEYNKTSLRNVHLSGM
ncbi:erythromycin esterase family protein, partial [Bacteroides thetaiotaomicron]|uniref:erythromycin esterase family protein n=1 Tax=Bacteroides thetaiotaomicron TaxID=818 RepID=UPI00210A70CA